MAKKPRRGGRRHTQRGQDVGARSTAQDQARPGNIYANLDGGFAEGEYHITRASSEHASALSVALLAISSSDLAFPRRQTDQHSHSRARASI